MKASQIAKQYGFNEWKVIDAIRECGVKYEESTFSGPMVADADVQTVVAYMRDAPKREKEQKEAKQRLAQMVDEMPHTSTPTFEGYRIIRYGGFVTGTATINTATGLIFTDASKVEEAVNTARAKAIHNLKRRVFNLDCNALVGLDVDFVSVDSHGMLNAQADSHYIVVCANGTAVEIEPIE